MTRSHWLDSLFSCFGGAVAGPPTKAVLQTPREEKSSGVPTKFDGAQNELIGVISLLWSYLARPERLSLRALCRDSRRIHDALVTDFYVCDEFTGIVLSGIPVAHLPRHPLPNFKKEAAHEVVTTLQGFTARGSHPQLLFICLADGNELRRHEEGLAVLRALTDASNDLSAVHLCGVPLTAHVARALTSLLPAPAPSAPSTCKAALPAPPPPQPVAPTVVAAPLPPPPSTLGSASMRSLTAVSLSPPALPLSLNLYGYDLSRPPAAATFELLVGAAAPRLMRLELWGCVGWPKRLPTLLHGCGHLRQLAVCFQPLLPPDGAVAVNACAQLTHGLPSPSQPAAAAAATAQQRAVAALTSGAVVSFPPIAAAATTAAVVKTIGGLHHLRSLELRGCVLNLARRASCESFRPGAATAVRPRTGPASRAAAERAAVAATAPSVQQLASALYQLTRLTRLSIDHLNSATPLLAAVAAMRGLRHLELPDAFVPAEADLAAIVRAAPRLASLTLGSVGPGSVLEAGGGGGAAAPWKAEVMPLPPALAVLRVARCRPTLRMMRVLKRTADARAAAAAAAAPASATAAAAGGGSGPPPPPLAAVVPGIEIDMLDVEYDALQGFSRGSDGVQRSTLLPESAEALVAAIRLLVPPPEAASEQAGVWGAAADEEGDASDDGLSTRAGGVSPPSFACASAPPSFGGSIAASSLGYGTRGGRGASAFNDSACGGGSGIVSTFGRSVSIGHGGGGSQADVKDGGGGGGDEGNWAPPSFGQTWTRELTIYNAHGSLAPPPSLEQQGHQQQQLLEPPGPKTAEAEMAMASEPPGGGAGGGSDVVGGADVDCTVVHSFPLVGHAVWISEMRPLGLLSLELYGIGVMAGDLEALAELHTLRRLTLASGELEVDGLPCLAALPHLEYLELARCHPCHCRRHGANRTASTGPGFTRASIGAAARAGGGGGSFARASASFGRGSGGACVGSARVSLADSDAAAADGDGGEAGRSTGKRALLELCMTAPRLRNLLVVRCMGMMSRAEAMEGPLGAEWVRQRLLAAGPRYQSASAAPPSVASAVSAGGGEAGGGLHRASWLGRGSKPVAAPVVTEEQLGWPVVKWD